MGIHDGHRKRVKKRFLHRGLDGFEDHAALELLLFYALPRGDVNPLAHRIMDTFGSFDAVFDAPIDELKRISGVGDNAATLIKLVTQINRRCSISRTRGDSILDKTEKAGRYLAPFFEGERDEVVYMVCLDAKFKVINCRLLFRGGIDFANVNVRKVVENALAHNAVGVLLAHNHISGVALPSRDDQDTTRRIVDALGAVDITLVDHIIIADGDYVSMADNGFFL